MSPRFVLGGKTCHASQRYLTGRSKLIVQTLHIVFLLCICQSLLCGHENCCSEYRLSGRNAVKLTCMENLGSYSGKFGRALSEKFENLMFYIG